ncbi:splicing factor ESS-2 homolog [Brassica napus]|uniref:splicing factor ESS-2 homolog n=1 Tax=Brassica napus TaxID=3708 RepID=UPI0006AAFE76|nr:splicing factor ESS-2 homolog [Brassica napus]
MFLSPGHSPRHLSSPSPSSYSDDGLRISSKIPPRNPRKRMRVLDEDAYVAAIEKIIERDYFPDISKLRDRLDWIQAVKTRDPIQIRDAQLKIIERRGKKANHHGGDTVGDKTQTPGSTFLRSFTPLDEFDGSKTPREVQVVVADDGDGGVDVSNMSLDQFFRRHTSEDNDSFSNILEKVNKRKKEKYGYLLEGGDANLIEDAKRDRITDGYGTSYQPPSTLQGWKYTAKNLLMYHPADRGEWPLTQEERAVRLAGLTKEIVKANTRFQGKTMDCRPREDGSVEILYTPIAGSSPVLQVRDRDKSKRYDLDDLRKTPNRFYVESDKKAGNGYSFVKTPSPAPGLDESPFITWGEIEGTPMRLDSEDTPLDIGGSADGPHYNIPSAPARDVRAHSLSRDASRRLRERSNSMFKKPPLPPSPYHRSGSASPNVRTLSPAAQKFFRRAIRKSSSAVDESLRASYRGASPGAVTPKSVSRFGKDRITPGSRSP